MRKVVTLKERLLLLLLPTTLARVEPAIPFSEPILERLPLPNLIQFSRYVLSFCRGTIFSL